MKKNIICCCQSTRLYCNRKDFKEKSYHKCFVVFASRMHSFGQKPEQAKPDKKCIATAVGFRALYCVYLCAWQDKTQIKCTCLLTPQILKQFCLSILKCYRFKLILRFMAKFHRNKIKLTNITDLPFARVKQISSASRLYIASCQRNGLMSLICIIHPT